MSKSKTEREAKKPAPAAKDSAPSDGGWRETVESVAMAVILALLFRGYVAEAFVIPTGSMAPTLDGRHKDIWCPKCGVQYQVSGSEEQREERITGDHVYSTTCPVCRYSHWLDPAERPNEGSFSGDRIIVGKFNYDFAEPKRWDVIVFKFPGNAVQNYIKRLIGLPGERVRIVGGNIYTAGNDEPDEALKIARKPPDKLNTLLQLVDDSDHIPKELTKLGWPARWQPWPTTESPWQALDGGRAFECKAGDSDESWIRYRNLVPSHSDWQTMILSHRLPGDVVERPGQLITDFYAYNTARLVHRSTLSWWRSLTPPAYAPPVDLPSGPGPGDPPLPRFLGQHWVDDLAVECVANVTSNQGELSLMLVRCGIKHFCRINVADGKAKLEMIDGAGQPLEFATDDGRTKAATPTATTSVRGPGRYRLRLSNCDHEMLLWVNGRVVAFDGPTTYDFGFRDDLPVPRYSAAEPGDLAPAGIASRGAAVKLTGLRIYRDKYYIASSAEDSWGEFNDYSRTVTIKGEPNFSEDEAIQQIFGQPDLWDESRSTMFTDENRRHVEFRLEADQFLPLGDNSPQSSDARFWKFDVAPGRYEDHYYVERDLLIGKALLIYWPHTWNRPVPFTPNFRRMGAIR
jgi:signal peptidase I